MLRSYDQVLIAVVDALDKRQDTAKEQRAT